MQKIIPVVNSILMHEEQILLLRRSPHLYSQAGKWSGVSGLLDAGQTAIAQAYQEIDEEIELTRADLILLAQSEPVHLPDSERENRILQVHPFLFSVRDPKKIIMNYENDRLEWVRFEQIKEFQTVSGLEEIIQNLLDQL